MVGKISFFCVFCYICKKTTETDMDIIAEGVAYVGAQDDDLDYFEGQYRVPSGISYNSYFIADEHSAIIDAVDTRRCGDWLEAVARASRSFGKQPSYLIVQHMEPDHSGSIADFCRACPDAKILCTKKAAEMLNRFFPDSDFSGRTQCVGDGETLSLGKTTLKFVTAPMVHWPEVMMTVDETHGIAYTADAFGSFAMWGSHGEWEHEARRYYSNIVGKYGPSVQSVMKKLAALDVSKIAPLHGPMLEGAGMARALELYGKWSRYEADTRGVLVAYASIYGATAEVAREIASRLREAGAGDVVTVDLCRHDMSDAVGLAFSLDRMVLCSVTCDGDMMGAMHDFLYHLSCKNLKNRKVALVENGSWAPVAGRRMAEMLADMKDMTVADTSVTIHSRRSASDEEKIELLVEEMAKGS